jgi:ABC-type Mn2+/Zn2+ transport system ATPase subunit
MARIPSIEIRGLSVSYDKKRVLTNIHMDLFAGNVYGVIGPNGAGKSTFFKSILGLIDNNAGMIKVLDSPIEEVRKRVAYVPQKDDVDWSFPATVMDIVLMGRYPHKKLLERINHKDREIAVSALDDLDIVDLKNRQIGELSGGQQQRVFIARALCQQAEVFLLDEPFVGVDMKTEEKIIDILRSKASEGKTLLVVHHDLASADDYFNKVILLNQRLIAYGDVETTFTKELIAVTYGPQLTILHKTGLIDK